MFRVSRFVRGFRSITIMATAAQDAAASATMATATTATTSTASTAGASPNTTSDPTPSLPRVPIPPRGVDYRSKVVLAPMVRSGELPSRLLALHYGADLVWGPETVDHSLIGAKRRVNPRTGMIEFTRTPSHAYSATAALGPGEDGGPRESVIYRLDPVREKGKLVFQLGTADPDRAVAAARVVAPDVAGIDVNAGCPKPFSISGGMGAALLRDPDRLVSILEALVREIPPAFGIGVSVKIRLLDTPRDTEALVRRLVATGITGLTVHCRTIPMRPREPAIRGQLRMIANVCREAGVACLMNGDVTSRDHASQLVAEFGADGAMIATAAEKNPSCFRTAVDGGLDPWQKVVERYVRFAMEVENKIANTKYLLTEMIPGKAPEHKKVHSSRCYSDIVRVLGHGDDAEFVKAAREADRVLGIGEFEPPRELKDKQKQKQREIQKQQEREKQQQQQQQQQQQKQQESKKRKREDGEDEAAGKPEAPGKRTEVVEVAEPVAAAESIAV